MTVDLGEAVGLLPHRPPFRFVDQVLELAPGERVEALYRVTGEEPFLAGHFPGRPIFPGVLQLEALAQAGAHVGISYFNRKNDADAVLSEIERHGVRSWAEAGDLSRRDDAEALFDRAKTELGGVDIFVGNAGLWEPANVPIAQMDDEQWRNTLAVNLDSIFYTTRAAARMMSDGGRIVRTNAGA